MLSFIPTDSSELYVSQIVQQVFLEINEDGSEAAASTGRTIGFTTSWEERLGGEGVAMSIRG